MIRVNLMPFRTIRKKENIRRQVSIFLLSCIFMGLIAYYYDHNLSRRINTVGSAVETAQRELAAFEKTNKEIARIHRDLDTLKTKVKIIQKLNTDRYRPVLLLGCLNEALIEKRMWFTRLTSADGSITLSGMAMDNRTIVDFMNRLEKAGLFQEVGLKTVKQVHLKEADKFVKSFEIICFHPIPAPAGPDGGDNNSEKQKKHEKESRTKKQHA